MVDIRRELVEKDDDPERCQGHVTNGQCPLRAEPGDKYCHSHNGRDRETPARNRKYMLTDSEMARRFVDMDTPEEIYSLREEIALCRMLLEKRLNSIKNEADLIIASPMINQQMLTLEKLVKAFADIEHRLHNQLSKDAIVMLGVKLSNFIADCLSAVPNSSELVDQIVGGLPDIIMTAANAKEKDKK